MPGTGQGIDVGDAVFTFLGDTQNLDAALDKVDQIPEKMGAATDSITDTTAAVEGLSDELVVGQSGAKKLGEVTTLAGTEARESLYQARGEAELLGEQFGIHLPRHVQSFIAELPGVGAAMSAAFSATAVLFLVQALVEGTEKLSNWIANTFIMTDAMKAANAEIAAENKLLLVQKAALEAATEEVKKFGLEGAALTQVKIDELSDSIKKNEESLISAKDTLYDYNNNGLHATKEQAEAAQGQIIILTKTLQAQNEELIALQLQQQKQALDEYIKFQESKLAAAKVAGDSEIKLTQSEELLKIAMTGGSYAQQLKVQEDAEQQLFKSEVAAVTERINLLATEGDKTKAERGALFAQLEKLTNDHNAKVYESYARAFQIIRQQAQTAVPEIEQPLSDLTSDITKSFDKAGESAQQLGFTFTGDLALALQKTQKAYKDLKDSGQATYGDLLQGQRAVLQAQIAYERELGKDTSDSQKALEKVNLEWDKLTGTINKTKVKSHDYFTQFKLDLKQGTSALDDLSQIGSQAFNSLTDDIQKSVASAILGQESLGQALEKATAQALATLASQALVKSLFYTAEGFAALAGFAAGPAAQYFEAAGIMAAVGAAAGVAARGLSGGGSSAAGGTGSNTKPADQSGAVQAQGQPVQTKNVQRLAAGGLISKQTIVAIGDSESGGDQQEAAIPLDDPRSLAAIVTAFQKAGMTSGGGGTVISFPHGTLVSPDNLKTVVKKINKMAVKGQVPTVSTNAQRLTKRSQ